MASDYEGDPKQFAVVIPVPTFIERTGIDVPLYVKDDFGDFYKASFERAAQREDRSAVFREYAWNMGWCDPCVAAPLSVDEMQKLGARWLDADAPRGCGMEATGQSFAVETHDNRTNR
jgi:hypothetical protein